MRKPDVDPNVLRELIDSLFGVSVPVDATRTPDGVSTQVYRLQRGRETFYLRIAEEEADSFEPEALVHVRLRQRGAKIPDIVALVPFHEPLARSVMVTTAIPGIPLGSATNVAVARRVIAAAGQDLATINDLAVEGFGWVRRDPAARQRLAADHASWAEFVAEDWTKRLGGIAPMLGEDVCQRLDDIVSQALAAGGPAQGRLAHGDFDLSHIYHHEGEYSGIIDFGEIRGADRWYDLGHFALHGGERLPFALLPDLLAGYRAARPEMRGSNQAITFWVLVIGVNALARSLGRGVPAYQRFMAEAIRRRICVQP